MNNTKLNKLKKRIYEISYNNGLSHIGSCITALPIIYSIYKNKMKNDPFILSSGHAGLALYVILEHFEGQNAQALYDKHGVHPNRDLANGIYASTGSLGHGIGIALGMAIANRKRQVHCLISDGEAREGSVWEALMIQQRCRITNLKIHCNFNGWGAYHKIYNMNFRGYNVTVHKTNFGTKVLGGQDAHYHKLTKEDYQRAIKNL